MADVKSDWQTKLAHIQDAAGTLESITDELNSAIDEAENAIVDLRLGVPGRVRLPRAKSEVHYNDLLFAKQDKAWRLIIESGIDIVGASFTKTPLKSANRETRLQAVEMLPALLENMIATAVKEIASVQRATAKTQQFVETIRAIDRKAK